MTSGSLYRLSAFSTSPQGGNPAGVWIGETLPDKDVMQQIAADVGFSETAFVAPASGRNRTIRFYSPETEVSFCGRAAIATGVVLGERTHSQARLGDLSLLGEPAVGGAQGVDDAAAVVGEDVGAS